MSGIYKYLHYEVQQIFVFCTFCMVSVVLSLLLVFRYVIVGVKLFAYGYKSLLLLRIHPSGL